ncbi:MAG TPA: hypothetical protein VGH10_05215 [Actinomycetota bacterium]|jgi:ribose/xylose/arabinose/galactoside ABC-type transport system permease subunit
MERNELLRLWGVVFSVVGVVAMALAITGVVVEVFRAKDFIEALVVLLIVAPIAVLLATWPLAFAQLLRAVADIADDVAEMRRRSS